MLPSLYHSADRDFKTADNKLFFNRQPSQQKRDNANEAARNSSKGKVGGGFKISKISDEPKSQLLRVNQYISQVAKSISTQKKSPQEISDQIRLIEKRIRQCQKKIDNEKKRKAEQERKGEENGYEQDFQEVIKRQMRLHGMTSSDPAKNFDYLTNPGGPPQEQELLQQPTTEEVKPPPPYNIADGIEKLQRYYENALKKKFERRQMFPHMACRRKTPKLYITQKTNALNKHGKPLTEQQHKFRVLTKETTPQEIYPVIPNFAVVKDNLSKNIVAYLGDYKPFLDKTKEKVEKEIKKEENQIVIGNVPNSIAAVN